MDDATALARLAGPARTRLAAGAGPRWLDRPYAVAGIAAVLAVGFVLVRLALHGWDLSAFVVAGDRDVDPALAPRELHLLHDDFGHDGRFFYRLALDPFTTKATDHGMTLDAPAYRQQRILYPLLAWATTHLSGVSTTVALVAVNLVALIVCAGCGAALARRLGRPAVLGLLVAFAPPITIALARDLGDATAWACALAGLTLWLGGRRALGALLLAAAVAARETTLIVAAGLGLQACGKLLRGGARPRDAVARIGLLVAGPLAVYVVIQAWLRHVWGTVAAHPVAEGLHVPFVTTLTHLLGGLPPAALAANPGGVQALWTGERFLLLALLLAMAWAATATRAPFGVVAGWVGGVVMAFSVQWLWEGQFMRVAGEAIVLGLLMAFGARGLRGRLTLEISAVLSVLMVVIFVFAE